VVAELGKAAPPRHMSLPERRHCVVAQCIATPESHVFQRTVVQAGKMAPLGGTPPPSSE